MYVVRVYASEAAVPFSVRSVSTDFVEKKIKITKFLKTGPVGVVLFVRTDRQTDGHSKTYSRL
jgi:hypothetical protein